MTEELFYRWVRMSNACLTAAKPPGKPWTLRLVATCAVTLTRVTAVERGTDPYFPSAMQALLSSPDLAPICVPTVLDILSKLSD